MRAAEAGGHLQWGEGMILPVEYPGGGYDIVLERGTLARAAEYLPQRGKALVVTDDGVPSDYARQIAAVCPGSTIVTLPQGEKTKNLDAHRALLSRMLELNFLRSDRVIAVGGGVMGDLAGFAAAVYMRGIDFYNIPTTLLSQVDSSIGGKVAVDMNGVKNVIGAFYQPRKVLIDPDTLHTLDRRQIAAGLAEAIKMAATSDSALFERMEQSENLEKDMDAIIEGSLRIKRDVVQQDPTEKGLRRVLNFGHTVGHAIESAMDGQWLHGECVAAGMLPMSSPEARRRIARVLEKYGLPTHTERTADELISYIKHDKKAADDGVKTVCVDEIGSFTFQQMSLAEIAERIRQWQ